MKYERTQKGNPHSLILNQHVFPTKSIKRFRDACGTVDVFLKTTSKQISLKPNDKLFCARRIWDQKSESGYMKDIEDSFQSLASKIVANQITELGEPENRIALDFFALWELKHHHNSNPVNDTELKGIHPGGTLTKNEEEILEKNGVIFTRDKNSSATIPSRFMNGSNIQISIESRRIQMRNLKWGIVKSFDGEFIVPDNFGNTTILPVSPKIILLGNSKNLIVPKSEVIKVNRLAIASSKTYYFARDLSNCPLGKIKKRKRRR